MHAWLAGLWIVVLLQCHMGKQLGVGPAACVQARQTSPRACPPACQPACSGMPDMFDMLQSPTFCSQVGYGVLEIAVVHLFPELKSLFRTLQHGGLG